MICLSLLINCAPTKGTASLSKQEKSDLRQLEPFIADIDLNNFSQILCQHQKDCTIKNNKHFDTAKKRAVLNEKSITGLIIAAQNGFSVKTLVEIVKGQQKARLHCCNFGQSC